ncbi:hypothetical protein [Vreelandella neptunia]|uniref:hypothetical protein n=1 Tax=Vreelandella neptunia TaxID=115551 RepID=UPI00315997C6
MTVLIRDLINIISSEEVSLMLEGADPAAFEMRSNYPDDHFEYQGETYHCLIGAAQKGEFKTQWVEVADTNDKGEVNRNLNTGYFEWYVLPENDDSWKGYRSNLVRFGVHRREINRWLKGEVGYREADIPESLRDQLTADSDSLPLFNSGSVNDKSEKKGKLKRTLQDNAILATLREMGVEPTQLPYRERGKNGYRADVKKKLLTSRRDLFSVKSYEKSWQRLRDSGRIC